MFSGTLEWQPAKAFIIGLVNKNGCGITVISATTKDVYAAIHEQVSRSVASSAQFFKAIVPDHTKEWDEALKNARLTYMDSNYSNDGSYGNTGYTTGGGYVRNRLLTFVLPAIIIIRTAVQCPMILEGVLAVGIIQEAVPATGKYLIML